MQHREQGVVVSGSEIIRLPEVLRIANVSRTTIWRWIKQGDFPAPKQLGGTNSQSIGWHRGDVDEWLNTRPTPHYAHTG